MNRLMFGAALGAMVWAFAPLGALAQTTPAPTPISISDDLNADGVKLRGDGSVDDDQPNADAVSDDDIGDDGLKHRGDGSVDDDQTGGEDHVRGRDRERDDRDDDHRGSDHDRGRDRDRDNDRGGNRGHG